MGETLEARVSRVEERTFEMRGALEVFKHDMDSIKEKQGNIQIETAVMTAFQKVMSDDIKGIKTAILGFNSIINKAIGFAMATGFLGGIIGWCLQFVFK